MELKFKKYASNLQAKNLSHSIFMELDSNALWVIILDPCISQ